MKNSLNINRESIKKVFRQAASPAFLLILLGAFLLWYTSKLSYEYTTEMPLNVRIDGKKYRLTAEVAGRGSILLAQRLSLKSKLNLTLAELSAEPSHNTEGALVIAPASLQKAINAKINELKIVEIVAAPEFSPVPVKPEQETQPEPSDETPAKK